MTREEIGDVVCTCLAAVGMPPADWDDTCEDAVVGDLGLGEEDVTSVILCIVERLAEEGCRVYLGPANFPAEATVGEVCDAVYGNHTCDE